MKNALQMAIRSAVAVLFMASGQGFGTHYWSDGCVHNINFSDKQDVIVDLDSPGMQTTLNLVASGFLSQPVRGFNDSRLNVSGGRSESSFLIYDRSQMTVSDGSVYIVEANDNSRVTIVGGLVELGLYAYGSTQITMSGGSVSILHARDSSRGTISGGHVTGLHLRDSGQIIMSGGTIGTDQIIVESNANLIIDGSNFAIDGTPFGFGEITSILGSSCYNEPSRQLTGTLANGDILNTYFKIGELGSITLIPEPASAAIMILGTVWMAAKRKYCRL